MKMFKNIFQRLKNKKENPFIFSAHERDSAFYRVTINDFKNGNIKKLNMIFQFARVVIKVETTNDFSDKEIKVSFFCMKRMSCSVSEIVFDHFLMKHQIPAELNDLINTTINQRQEQINDIKKELMHDQHYRKVHGRGLND